MIDGGLHNMTRAQHIIRDRFDDIHFHQRDMLVSGSMKHNLGLVLLKYLREPSCIAYISDHRGYQKVWVVVMQLQEDLKNAVLAMTKQDQLCGMPPGDLAASMENGGETFVLNMGKPIRVLDLAEDLIRLSGLEPHRDVEIQYTGIRRGEKLVEELWEEGTPLTRTLHPDVFHLAKEDFIPSLNLSRAIEALSTSVRSGDTESIIGLLDGLVPGSSIREALQPDITFSL